VASCPLLAPGGWSLDRQAKHISRMRPLAPGCYAPRRQLQLQQHGRSVQAGITLTLCPGRLTPRPRSTPHKPRHMSRPSRAPGCLETEVCAPRKPHDREHVWQSSTARLQARTMFAKAAARSASNLRGLLSATHLPVGRVQVQHGVVADRVDAGSGLVHQRIQGGAPRCASSAAITLPLSPLRQG